MTRLPNTSFPLHYNIHLTTNIHRGDFNYKGNCIILIKVIEKTDKLVLQAENLTIIGILLTNDLKNEKTKEKLNFTTINNFLIIKREHFKNEVKSFEAEKMFRIEINFTGVIRSINEGIKILKYSDSKGNKAIGAYTLFQPDKARTALPCYDEPAFKAKFVLHITHGANITAISNMPQETQILSSDNKTITTSFMESEIMSIYLLAFILADIKYIQPNTNQKIPIRIFSIDTAIKNDKWNIFEQTVWGLETMEKLFNVSHNVIKKVDFIIFEISDAGGMENWGLFYLNFVNGTEICIANQCFLDVYTEKYLFFHELCHHWFGNLVSIEWWTDLWLNEGLATYYAYVLADLKLPEHRLLERFHANICLEQLMSSKNGVLSQYEDKNLKKKFDATITYEKAACILQMFEHAFDQKTFRLGLSYYLKANLYSTVNENDLYDGIQYALLNEHKSQSQQKWNYSVHDIMKSWTHANSFPTIFVERDYTLENSGIIKITQLSDEKFWIPLTFATTKNHNFEITKADYFMRPTWNEIILDLNLLNITLKPDDWLVVNKNAKGYYKVIYDDTNLERLIVALNENRQSISPLNRALLYVNILQRENDVINLNLNDFKLIESLRNEDDPLVWLTAARNIIRLNIYNYEIEYEMLISFLKDVFEPKFKDFQNKIKTKTKLSSSENFLYKELQELAYQLDFETYVYDQKYTETLFQNILNEVVPENYDKEGVRSYSCIALKNITHNNYDRLLKYFHDNIPKTYCITWIISLQCTQREELYLKFLDISLNDFRQCECKLGSIFRFLRQKFTETWIESWKKIKESLLAIIEDTNCTKLAWKYFDTFYFDIRQRNFEKFKSAFENYTQFTEIYNKKEEKRKEEMKDKIFEGEWLKNTIKNPVKLKTNIDYA